MTLYCMVRSVVLKEGRKEPEMFRGYFKRVLLNPLELALYCTHCCEAKPSLSSVFQLRKLFFSISGVTHQLASNVQRSIVT